MLNLTHLNQFLIDAKASIDTINFTDLVADDSELVSILKDRKETDNHYLIAVIPDYKLTGNENSLKWNNQLMFMVVSKASSRTITKAERNTIIGEVQQTAKAVIELILEKKSGDNGDFCGMMNEVIEDSILMTIVWEKAQCHGWIIEIDLLTKV
jgi:hypothetical protein